MAHYPDPDSARAGDGAGPFYTHNKPAMNAQAAMELSAQLVREVGPGSVPETSHIIPHGQDSNSHLEPKFTRPISSSQNYPPPHLGQMSTPGQQFTTENSNGEGSENRKKSKVSRACDECRRKKIRCDADSESNNATKCSNCTRTQAECKFSRVPMKRGPSKGYIKELADRLDHVEKNLVRAPEFQGSAMSPSHMSPQMPDGYARTDNFIRKRTHSESEGLPQHAYLQSQLQSAAENYPFGYGQESPGQISSQPYLHIQPQQPAPIADMSYRPTMQGYHHAATNGTIVNGQPGQLVQPNLERLPDTTSPWKDRLIDEYYQKIHPTFPLLAYDKNELRALLSHALTPLRDAFFEALYMVARSSATTPTIQHPAPQEHYERIAMRGESTNFVSRSNLANLVYLQTSILMVIALDTCGPPSRQPPNLPERAVWFGRALVAAQHLKLPDNEVVNTISGMSIDTVHAQNRRAWWTLVVVDRWHAVGTATAPQISEFNTNFAEDDRQLLGEQLWDLARHSRFFVHMATTFMQVPTMPNTQFQFVTRMLTSSLEGYRESVLPLSARPLIHLAFKHAALLHARNLTSPFADSPRNIPHAALTFASLLFQYQPTLLGMHFLALTAKTLMQLAEIKEERPQALDGLNTLKQAGEKMGPLRPGSWEAVILDVIKAKIAEAEGIDGAGLRSLADAAVGGGEGEGANTNAVLEDWNALTREGYLNVWG